MTTLEIIATCIGVGIFAVLGIGFWQLLRH